MQYPWLLYHGYGFDVGVACSAEMDNTHTRPIPSEENVSERIAGDVQVGLGDPY